MAINMQVKATGDINPARFITIDTTANASVVESNAGDTIVLGIADEATKDTPDANGSSLAAESGDYFRYYGYGDETLLEMDAVGCTAGDYLIPDNSGMGNVAGAADVAFALALETAAANELVRVIVISAYQLP